MTKEQTLSNDKQCDWGKVGGIGECASVPEFPSSPVKEEGLAAFSGEYQWAYARALF